MPGWKFYLITKEEIIESPIVQPHHPKTVQGNGKILMLIAKTCKEIEKRNDDVVSWKIKWFNE